MRHKKSGRQFGRDTSSRRAMLRNLAANLITHERIETTEAKAKELRRVAEKLITKATRLGKVAYTKQADLTAAQKADRLAVSRTVASYLPRWGVKTDGTKIDIVEKLIIEFIDAAPPVDKVAPTAAPEAATAGPSEATATATTEPETAAS